MAAYLDSREDVPIIVLLQILFYSVTWLIWRSTFMIQLLPQSPSSFLLMPYFPLGLQPHQLLVVTDVARLLFAFDCTLPFAWNTPPPLRATKFYSSFKSLLGLLLYLPCLVLNVPRGHPCLCHCLPYLVLDLTMCFSLTGQCASWYQELYVLFYCQSIQQLAIAS